MIAPKPNVQNTSAPDIIQAPVIILSKRRKEVLDVLTTGKSEKEAARSLGLSQHTIHVYVKGLYRTFRVHSRGELLSLWIKRGK